MSSMLLWLVLENIEVCRLTLQLLPLMSYQASDGVDQAVTARIPRQHVVLELQKKWLGVRHFGDT